MKKSVYLRILPLFCCVAFIQPVHSQGLGNSSSQEQQSSSQGGGENSTASGQSGSDAASEEPANPKILGMEIPLLDPASDTVSYNGSKFDVGNNAAVRARFEKYLQQNPDDTEARRYQKKMRELLKLTGRSARDRRDVGSELLVKIGNGLYELNEYPDDGGVSGSLASAIASALAVQYANRDRSRKNKAIRAEIDALVEKTSDMTDYNLSRTNIEIERRNKAGSRYKMKGVETNTYKIAHNTASISELHASSVKNDADSAAAYELSKIQFQSTIVSMLMQRRYEHALIGAYTYRHIFPDGDTVMKMDENSAAAKLFSDGTGLPPTVNGMSSFASGMRRDVDQHMEAVANMLAQNKLSDATQSLIQAVATGEHMQSVVTFPVEGRRRIAEFWSLRRKALTTLNARDYGATEEIAARMKELDPDFDDSLLTSYCAGRKAQSDLHLRNAVKALKAGDDAKFNEEITKAGAVWPKNPNLEKGRQELVKLDNQDPVRDEFRSLFARKEFRSIYNEQDKFEVVAIDPQLKQQYKDAITLISTIDGMLAQLDVAAAQDAVMGPCMAYEMLLEKGKNDERFTADAKYRDALNRYALSAHDFTMALEKAKTCEERREYGSALSNYYRALCLYPRSTMAGEGAKRVTEIILKAKF